MSTGQIHTFMGDECNFQLGTIKAIGLAASEWLTYQRTVEAWTTYTGCDGTVGRSRTRNSEIRFTLSLAQYSPANDKLSALHLLDLETGTGIANIVYRDKKGRTLIECPYAWITNFPQGGAGDSIRALQWVIAGAYTKQFMGGNG